MPDARERESYSYRLPDHWIIPDEGLFAIRHAHYVSRVVSHIVASGARRVLEVGCGDGWNCAQLVAAGLDVAGIDWSPNAIAYARILVPDARFEVCDVRDPRFREYFPDPFDAVAFVEVLEHIPPDDCVSALRTLRDCLRPGGVLVLTTPSTNIPATNPQHYRHFDVPTLRDLIGAAGGLALTTIEGYGDARAERRHYRVARWVDNRYYRIKPALRWLEGRYRRRVGFTGPNRCSGLIAVAQRAST